MLEYFHVNSVPSSSIEFCGSKIRIIADGTGDEKCKFQSKIWDVAGRVVKFWTVFLFYGRFRMFKYRVLDIYMNDELKKIIRLVNKGLSLQVHVKQMIHLDIETFLKTEFKYNLDFFTFF